MGLFGKECHLTFRVATVGTVRVSLDEFSDRETICGFGGRDRGVYTHELNCSPYETHSGQTAPVSIHLRVFSPNSFWVPGAGSRSVPGFHAQATNLSSPL